MPKQSLNRDINYLSKDFDSIKADLMDYVKRHFPNDAILTMLQVEWLYWN